MILWIDDLRQPPNDPKYFWVKSTIDAIHTIYLSTRADGTHGIDYIDIDHDAGDYSWNGGDFIEVLNWMERHNINDIPIRIHSMNPVGRDRMRAIIRHNNWKEIL